jgi:hypothetical protein
VSRGPNLVLALIGILATAASIAIIHDAAPAEPSARARAFHRLVGGLGFGPAISLEPCAFSFDPRVCPACPYDCGPIPCGQVFCPYHAGALLDYPPLAP